METWWGQGVHQTATVDSCESAGGVYDHFTGICKFEEPEPEPEPEPPGACVPSDLQMCFHNGRFAVKMAWNASDGRTGSGRVTTDPVTDSGLFYFFEPSNREALIKVLDGRAINGSWWVFASCATDLGLDIKVTDTVTGAEKVYSHQPPGTPFVAITDTASFPDEVGPRP
jgi:hypothetical protein